MMTLPMVVKAQQEVGAVQWPFQDTTLSVETRVNDLLGRLTLDEKLSMMEHQNPAIERLGLKPYSWWNEALHGVARNGVATVYPMPIALAASFDPWMVKFIYVNVAQEAVRKHREAQDAGEYGDYKGLTFFTPNINIFRDPRWGRGMETFGEDPYLTARMGQAAVDGLQGTWRSVLKFGKEEHVEDSTGDNPSHAESLLTAACLKHLAVHSGPEGLRHEFDSRVTKRDLWNTYLPAFEYIIKHSDVQQVMCGYNRLNGEPCCTNRELLVDILRNRWHYNGILVTDCWALNDCWEPDTVIPRHRTHPTAAMTAAAAFGSEVDLECGSGLEALRIAVDSGYISEHDIDTHVRRLLTTRMRIRPEHFKQLANGGYADAETACKHSLVMLKNDGVLPLQVTRGMRFAVVGPNAADSAMMLGNYNGEPARVTTLLRGFEIYYRNRRFNHAIHDSGLDWDNQIVNIYFDTACHHADNDYQQPTEYWSRIEQSDVVIFCGGLSPALEGEELSVELPGFHKGDRTSIELPAVQRDMIKAIRRHTDKPIVLVLCTGSAIALEEVVDDVNAIVVAWYGGEAMGSAVASSLHGDVNLFGRLPVTFYRSTGQLPLFEDYNMQGRTYRYMTEEPLYPFGYGLSYGRYHYERVHLDRRTMTLTGEVVLDSIDSRANVSQCKAVVQVYLTAEQRWLRKNDTSISAQDSMDEEAYLKDLPRRQLVALQSIYLDLEKNPRQRFSIAIEPDWLRYYNSENDSLEPLPIKNLKMELQVPIPGEGEGICLEVL